MGARRLSHWTTREVTGLHPYSPGCSWGSMDFWACHHAMRGPQCMPGGLACASGVEASRGKSARDRLPPARVRLSGWGLADSGHSLKGRTEAGVPHKVFSVSLGPISVLGAVSLRWSPMVVEGRGWGRHLPLSGLTFPLRAPCHRCAASCPLHRPYMAEPVLSFGSCELSLDSVIERTV